MMSRPITRTLLWAAIGLVGLGGAIAGVMRLAGLPTAAFADTTVKPEELNQPGPLGDVVLGAGDAKVTIIEYASMTCPHCAEFHKTVFPVLKSKYIDTGKVRFVSREFPLEIKAAGASMLARCAASGDAQKYFDAIGMLFKEQQALVEHTTDTLKAVGGKFGMSEEAVETCVKDNALLDKIKADQDFAYDKLKVDATPTFFINGERLKGSMSFEEFEKKLAPLLKR
jgi:protein-disulfide isomerase